MADEKAPVAAAGSTALTLDVAERDIATQRLRAAFPDVPFRGANPAINDVMGGHVSMIFSSLPPTLGNIKSGALRALAIGSLQRSPILPDLPTIDESGLRGFEAQQVYGLLAPAGTPAGIVKRLNAALQDALTSDLVKTRIAADGAEAAPGSPEDYARDIDREEAKWSKVVEEAGAKAP